MEPARPPRGKMVAHLVPAVDHERALRRAAVERFRARRRQWRRIDMTTEEILASIREGRTVVGRFVLATRYH